MKRKISMLLVIVMLMNLMMPVGAFALTSDESTVFISIEDHLDVLDEEGRPAISFTDGSGRAGYVGEVIHSKNFDRSSGITVQAFVDEVGQINYSASTIKVSETLFVDTTADYHHIMIRYYDDEVVIEEVVDNPTDVIIEHDTYTDDVFYMDEEDDYNNNHIIKPGSYTGFFSEKNTTSSGGIELSVVVDDNIIVSENDALTYTSSEDANIQHYVSTSMGAITVYSADIAYNTEEQFFVLDYEFDDDHSLIEFNTNSTAMNYYVWGRMNSEYYGFIFPDFAFNYASPTLTIEMDTYESGTQLKDLVSLEDGYGNIGHIESGDDVYYTLSDDSGVVEEGDMYGYLYLDAPSGTYDLVIDIPGLGLSATKEIIIEGYDYSPTTYDNYIYAFIEIDNAYEGEYIFEVATESQTVSEYPYISSYSNKDIVAIGFDSTEEFVFTLILDENDDGELSSGETYYQYTDDGTRNMNSNVSLEMMLTDDNLSINQNTIALSNVNVQLNGSEVSMYDEYGYHSYYGSFYNEFDYLAVPGEYDINYIDDADSISIYYVNKEVTENEVSTVELTDTPLNYSKDISITTGSDYTFDSIAFRGTGTSISSSTYLGRLYFNDTTSVTKTVDSSIELVEASIYLEFGNNMMDVDIPFEYLDQAVFNEGSFVINGDSLDYGRNDYEDFLRFVEGDKSYVVDFSMNDLFIEIYNANNELVYGNVNWFVYDYVMIEDTLSAGTYTLKMFSEDMLFDIESEFTLEAPVTPPSSGGSTPSTPSTPPSSGGSTPSTPTTPLDDETKDAVTDIEESIKNGTTDELANAAGDLIDGIDETSDKVDEQISDISETVAAVVGNIETEAAVVVVNDLVELASDSLENLTANEASDMVTDIIDTAFNALSDKENVDLEETKEDILDLVDKVVEKASTVEANEGTLVDETLEYVVDEDLIANSIAVATDVINDLTATLEENGIEEETEKTINITLPETEGEDISLELDVEAVAELGDNNFGITIEAEGIDITLPAELLSSASATMKIKSKPVSNDMKLSSDTRGGKAKELKTLDLDVSSGTESIKGMVELSFSLEDLSDVDLDKIMVGVYEDGEWTKIDYEIKGNKVYFTAPHFSIYSLMSYEASFSDIETNWAKKCIESLAAKGIINGRDDVTFDPDSTITRAEYMALLVNYLGLDNPVTSNYKDVEQGAWYYDIIGQGAMNGITAGTENGNFRPDDNITREEMAVMLMKAFEVKNGYALQGEELTFADTDEMSVYAVAYVEAAKANGIISGYPDNTFRPSETATRAEAATVIYYFLQK